MRICRMMVTLAVFTLSFLGLTANGDEVSGVEQAECGVGRIALFKNGLAYFQSSVAVPEGVSEFQFWPEGSAAHGTFWLSWPSNLAVGSIVASQVQEGEETVVAGYAGLLEVNPGAQVQVEYDDDLITGTVREVLGGRLVVLDRSDEGVVYLELGRIRSVTFLSGTPVQTTTTEQGVAQLTVHLEEPTAGPTMMEASYLTQGITWAPSYQIDISDPDEAVFSAKAVIINEVADFDNVEVLLVTGYPQVQFADVLSPLTLRQEMEGFLGSLRGGNVPWSGAWVGSNVMVQSAGGPHYGAPSATDAGSGQTEDLFLYSAGELDLPRGATAYVPLCRETVPYRHVYTWDINDYLVETRGTQLRGAWQPEEQAEEIVWHVVRLENTTDMPWTTAPAMTVKDGMILGQGTLNYTPIGIERDLVITRALNVMAEEAENEVSRNRSAVTLNGRQYDIATVEGVLRVTNGYGQEIYLEITKTLSGEVLESSPEAEIEQPGRGLMELNGMRILTWAIELAPGEQQEITYRYQLYVPVR